MVIYIQSDDNPADIMTKNTKESLFIKHSLAMKKGVLLVGALNREDVVNMVELDIVSDGRWSDKGIFFCVPSSTSSDSGLSMQDKSGEVYVSHQELYSRNSITELLFTFRDN